MVCTGGNGHGNHDARPTVSIIEYYQRARENEKRVRSPEGRFVPYRKALDYAGDVVTEKPDDPAPELAELRGLGRRFGVDERGEVSKRIGGLSRVVPAM